MFKVGDLVMAPKNHQEVFSDYFWDLSYDGPYVIIRVDRYTFDLRAVGEGFTQSVPKEFVKSLHFDDNLDKFM